VNGAAARHGLLSLVQNTVFTLFHCSEQEMAEKRTGRNTGRTLSAELAKVVPACIGKNSRKNRSGLCGHGWKGYHTKDKTGLGKRFV